MNFLIETKRQQDKLDLPDPHDYLADLSAFLRRRSGEAVLLGEVNLPYPDLMQFFGVRDGGGSTDELTMCFDFIGMQAMYLSLARGDAGPLVDALKQRPEPPEDGHWATFVRNHDELTLDKLSDAQRQEVFTAFGPDEDMQLYGRGIRRRLPTMLDGDQRRIRMIYSLLFALPGTPVLFYGEEIGLGDNLEIEGRLAVRVPMQWTAEPGAGFSTADPSTFPEPLAEGEYGPEHVNVRDQSRDPDSLLTFFRHLVDSYRACPELAWGKAQVIDPGPDAAPVLAHRADADGVAIVALHNFADAEVTAALPLSGLAETALYDVLAADGSTEKVGADGTLTVTLPPYGYRWLRSAPRVVARRAGGQRLPRRPWPPARGDHVRWREWRMARTPHRHDRDAGGDPALLAAKAALRDEVWDALTAAKVARFPGARNRISNFVGADVAAERLRGTPEWAAARTVKANPDSAQLPVRQRALQDGMTVYMAVPRLAEPDPFFMLDPAHLADPPRKAASIAGATRSARRAAIAELEPVHLVVTGCVAVGEDGTRLGKGGGFADLEFALASAAGLIGPDTVVVTTVHELQLRPAGTIPTAAHDAPVDLVVTPHRLIDCRAARGPRPEGGIRWSELTDEKIAAIPLLAALRPR